MTRWDDELGPFRLLRGTWRGCASGWSTVALPVASAPPGRLDYRLVLDQFDETLTFTPAERSGITLESEHQVSRVAAVERPAGGGVPGDAVRSAPALLLHMRDPAGGGPTIARLAAVPHGDAALALGNAVAVDGPPRFEDVDVLPIGVPQSLENPYLEPYRFFHEHPFRGRAGFPGFDPTRPQALLQHANQRRRVARTTVLLLDTQPVPRDVPFVVQEASATRMQSIFWINELVEEDAVGAPKLQLQYLQVVDLEFFPRRDGRPGRIVWPHVSINTLEKVSGGPATAR
jgi:hypothetical protein